MARKALSKAQLKWNLSIPRQEVANLDDLRVQTEASSDSEITRQALRYLEQLVNDEQHGIVLKEMRDGKEELLPSSRFRDRLEDAKENLVRRSLILHEQSVARLKRLQDVMRAKDPSEVVRCALRFYEHLVRAGMGGAQFFAVFPSRESFQVRFPFVPGVEPDQELPAQQPQPPGYHQPGGTIHPPQSDFIERRGK